MNLNNELIKRRIYDDGDDDDGDEDDGDDDDDDDDQFYSLKTRFYKVMYKIDYLLL